MMIEVVWCVLQRRNKIVKHSPCQVKLSFRSHDHTSFICCGTLETMPVQK